MMLDPTPPQIGWAMTEPRAALEAFLSTLPNPPQLLGLGEPAHGVEAFPAWRNRVFRVLVENHGYRSVALESDVLAGLRVDAYAASGRGTLDDAMRHGFSHGFGEVNANRELVIWLRAFNAGRGEADRVRFYGFDAPLETMWAASPRHALLELHAYLAERSSETPPNASTITRLCGDDARWTDPAAATDPSRSVGKSEDAARLRWLADELLTLLETEMPRLLAQPDRFWHARLHARTALGLLRYHALMAKGSPNRVSRLATLRDLMMADTLMAVAEREAARGPTLVFAHNTHLQRHLARWASGTTRLEWCPAGVHLAARLGGRYAVVATAAGQGAGLSAPSPDTPEGWLSGQSGLPRLYASGALVRALPSSLVKRTDTSGRPGYSPLKPEHLEQTDGVLFLPTLTPQESSI